MQIWSFGSSWRLPEVEFDSEIPTRSPPEVELEAMPLIVEKRQIKNAPTRDRKVPAFIRIPNFFRINSAAHRSFIGNSDHITREVGERIAHVPHEIPAMAVRSIPVWRVRFAGILKPPHGIQFIVEMNIRQIRSRFDHNTVPARRAIGG